MCTLTSDRLHTLLVLLVSNVLNVYLTTLTEQYVAKYVPYYFSTNTSCNVVCIYTSVYS